jgi:hypothetical protein
VRLFAKGLQNFNLIFSQGCIVSSLVPFLFKKTGCLFKVLLLKSPTPNRTLDFHSQFIKYKKESNTFKIFGGMAQPFSVKSLSAFSIPMH